MLSPNCTSSALSKQFWGELPKKNLCKSHLYVVWLVLISMYTSVILICSLQFTKNLCNPHLHVCSLISSMYTYSSCSLQKQYISFSPQLTSIAFSNGHCFKLTFDDNWAIKLNTVFLSKCKSFVCSLQYKGFPDFLSSLIAFLNLKAAHCICRNVQELAIWGK